MRPNMSSRNSAIGSGRFSSALTSAVFEWILILLLFIEASISYLVTKFSRICKLQPPCILCSRIDHLLDSEDPGFYLNQICYVHKLEISSLAFCHVHQKLANVHSMCESCLLSFATANKSNAETYRSLMGSFGLDVNQIMHDLQLTADGEVEGEGDGNDDGNHLVQGDHGTRDLLKEDDMPNHSVTRKCSCCSNPSRLKPHGLNLLRDKITGVTSHELDFSAESLPSFSNIHHEDSVGKRKMWSINSSASQPIRGQGVDPFSHVGYSEVKITSDSESEIPLSDDDKGSLPLRANKEKEAFALVLPDSEPLILVQDTSEPLAYVDRGNVVPIEDDNAKKVPVSGLAESESLLLVPDYISATLSSDDNGNAKHVAVNNSKEVFASVDSESVPLILVQDNWPASFESDIAQEISIDPPTHILDAYELLPEEHLCDRETLDPLASSSSRKDLHETCDILIQDEANSLQYKVVPQDEVSNTKDNLASDVAHVVTTSLDVMMDWSSNKVNREAAHDKSEPCPPTSTHVDLDDLHKLHVHTSESSMFPTSADIIIKRDSFKVQEYERVPVSQISALPEIESLRNESRHTPRIYGEEDEAMFRNILKPGPMERNESGVESREGSIVSEIEGETTVERLKRQIESDRKSINLLHEELEEERNAAADAANQAMAMITKLQEEKAALQMAALQYQREMEEQAEYHLEELGMCHEQLAEKEQQIQDLEAEVEFQRNHFLDESPSNKVIEMINTNTKKILDETNTFSKDSGTLKNPPLYLEDEKAYISDCLTKLEEKLHRLSKDVEHDDSGSDIEGGRFPNGFRMSARAEDGTQFSGSSESGVRINGHYSGEVEVTGGSVHFQQYDSSQENSQPGGFLDGNEPDGICMDANGEDCIRLYNMSEINATINGQYSNESVITRSSEYPLQEELLNSTASSVSVKGTRLVYENDLQKFKSKKESFGERNENVTLDDEVSHLRLRLEALELDRNILEHTISALKIGEDGMSFIQEIACSLRELRRIGVVQQKHLLT